MEDVEPVEDSGRKRLAWVVKVPPYTVGALALMTLITATGLSGYYSLELDRNRQTFSYVSDLKQMAERIEKNSLLTHTAEAQAYKD